DEVFIGAAGEDGIEPHDRPDGAIAIVRNRKEGWSPNIQNDIVSIEAPQGGPANENARVFYFGAPAEKPLPPSFTPKVTLTIEDVADGQSLEADLRLDDYSYGRTMLPGAKQYFSVGGQPPSQLIFRQGKRRFQVIRIDRDVEGPPHPCGPEQ